MWLRFSVQLKKYSHMTDNHYIYFFSVNQNIQCESHDILRYEPYIFFWKKIIWKKIGHYVDLFFCYSLFSCFHLFHLMHIYFLLSIIGMTCQAFLSWGVSENPSTQKPGCGTIRQQETVMCQLWTPSGRLRQVVMSLHLSLELHPVSLVLR